MRRRSWSPPLRAVITPIPPVTSRGTRIDLLRCGPWISALGLAIQEHIRDHNADVLDRRYRRQMVSPCRNCLRQSISDVVQEPALDDTDCHVCRSSTWTRYIV